MSGPSPVERRLRAVLEESRLSGLPLPDETTWRRRFPGHADVVREVFAELAPNTATELLPIPAPAPTPAPTAPPTADVTETSTSVVPLTPPEPPETTTIVEASLPVWAEPREELTIVREDAHGRLCRDSDGRSVYVIPKARLQGRNPASEYLARARRLAAAEVAGVQAPTITSLESGDVCVRFDALPERVVSLRVGAAQRRGATRRALEIMGRVAARVRSLHERGAAHGRLDRGSLRLDTETRRLIIGTGLEDGPGVDGGTLGQQQVADIRSLGALLYGALAFEGTEPDAREILARHDAHELPALSVRRPDLSRALVKLVDRALRGGGSGYRTVRDLLDALDRICDHESDATPAGPERTWRPRLVTAAASVVLIAVLAACHLLSSGPEQDDARLALRSGSSERIGRIRSLLEEGRRDEALKAWRELEQALGLTARTGAPSGGG